MSLETPIAFFIFNRPAVTARVFAAIAAMRPARLLVIADGPRANRPGEAERCAATREVIKKVDWPCEVLTNFADANLGCGKRVSTGLDWVFDRCEDAIILEDDCLPCPDFFIYCQTLLDHFRHDERIMHIGGNGFHGNHITYPGSYYFTRYAHIWGWATWRRAWKHYDFAMNSWPALLASGGLTELFSTPVERAYFERTWADVHSGKVDTWDAQWAYMLLIRGALAINPAKNLVSNLGFGADATHTHGASWMGNMPTEPLGEIQHPAHQIEHRTADERTFRVVFDGARQPPTKWQKKYRAVRKKLGLAIKRK